MTVLITLTSAGTDTSIFDLYSDLDGYITPFETGITKTVLQAGYTTSLVPNYTNVIRIQSLVKCTNYIDVTLTTPIIEIPTPNTTSTTTTIAPIICVEYTAGTFAAFIQYVDYIDCNGIQSNFHIGGTGQLEQQTFCAKQGSVTYSTEVFLLENGPCPTTTTTTTVASTTTTTTI